MSDNPNVKSSEPAPEKDDAKKAKEAHDDPKRHGSHLAQGGAPSEDFDQTGEGSTGTKRGSTDS